MKIGLVELQDHIEVLRNFCLVLVDTGHEVTVVCKKNIADELQDIYPFFQRKIDWHHTEEGESQMENLQHYRSHFLSCDLLFLITLKHFSYSALRLIMSKPCVLIVHNVNGLFFPFQSMFINKENPWKDMLRIFYFILSGRFLIQSRIKNAALAIGVASPTISEYLSNRLSMQDHLVKAMPFSLYENGDWEYNSEPQGVINIVIPGTVDEGFRDYEQVAEALGEMIQLVELPVKLCLLGVLRKRARKVLHYFVPFTEKGGQLEYFEQILSQQDFDEKIKKADFLILPLRLEKKVGFFCEFTGFSSTSGNVNDMIRWGIPSLIPEFYPLPLSLEKLVLRYSSGRELAKKIIYWIESRDFLHLRNAAEQLMEEYSTRVQKESLQDQIREFLNRC